MSRVEDDLRTKTLEVDGTALPLVLIRSAASHAQINIDAAVGFNSVHEFLAGGVPLWAYGNLGSDNSFVLIDKNGVTRFKITLNGDFQHLGGNVSVAGGSMNALTGFQQNSGAISGHVLRGNGTNFVDAALAAADLSNGVTGSGAVVLATSPSLLGSPVAPTQAAGDNTTKIATDAFVTTAINNAVAGVNPAVAVQAATTQASDTSGFTYNNGVSGIGATLMGSVNTAVTVDGFTFTGLGQRLLVKNDTQSPSGAFNGVYYVTQLQTVLLPPVLTRALDYDMPSDINNTGAIPVVNGSVNALTSWLLTSTVNTVGTDPLTYAKFSTGPVSIIGIDSLALGAAVTSTLLYAVPANGAGLYRVLWCAKVTRIATTSSILGGSAGFQIGYTDADDSVVVTTLANPTGNANGNTTGVQISGVFVINAKASTNVNYQMDYTSVGATSMQYSLHVRLEKL